MPAQICFVTDKKREKSHSLALALALALTLALTLTVTLRPDHSSTLQGTADDCSTTVLPLMHCNERY